MLQHLSVTNYALIDKLELSLENGLTIITGETGAGKSILLGALGLVLGNRADTSALYNTEQKCVVEAVFDLSAFDLVPFFAGKDWDYARQTIIRREILPAGKSRAFVNDTPVTVADLKELGQQLIDIHSQHETWLLSDNRFQLHCIDMFAGNQPLLLEYERLFDAYKQLQQTLSELEEKNTKALADLDYIRFQFEELEQARLDTEEYNVLENEQELLQHAEQIQQALTQALHLLSESESSALNEIYVAKNSLSSISGKLKEAEDIQQRLQSVHAELKDICAEADSLMQKAEHNPKRLEEIQERLDLLNHLLHKHRLEEVSQLLALKEKYEQDIQGISTLEDTILQQKQALQVCTQELEATSLLLRKARMKAIPSFCKQVEKMAQDTGMPQAEFSVQAKEASEFLAHGKDQLSFYFTANKGKEPAPLNKVASGGELSRVMLSIKAILAGKTNLPSIVFDEIDTGISGETADRVGGIIQEMANRMQVIAITHQAQIAAKGKQHLFVYKETQEDKTFSRMKVLQADERVKEIAKMLSGAKVSDAALQHARLLLGNA